MKYCNLSSNGSAENCTPVENKADDYVVTSVWATLCLFGLASNLCVVLGVGANRKLRWSASYWLIVSLSFCDVSMLIVCAVHILPLTAGLKITLDDEFFAQPTYSGHFENAFAIFIYDAFWYSGVLHLMLMALNRFVNICKPSHYARLFSRGKTFAYIWTSYVAGVAVAVPGLHYCCYLVYNRRTYAAQFLKADTAFVYADLSINIFCVLVMIVCYTKIVIRVRRSRITLNQYKECFKHQSIKRNTKGFGCWVAVTAADNSPPSSSSMRQRMHSSTTAVTSRRELRLLFQFASVSLIFLLSLATWNWLPRLVGSKWAGFVVTTLFFVNNCINPVVYLLFNDALRRQLAPKSSCCRGRCAAGVMDCDGEDAKRSICYDENDRCGFCGMGRRSTTTLYTAVDSSRRHRSSNGQSTTATRRRTSERRQLSRADDAKPTTGRSVGSPSPEEGSPDAELRKVGVRTTLDSHQSPKTNHNPAPQEDAHAVKKSSPENANSEDISSVGFLRLNFMKRDDEGFSNDQTGDDLDKTKISQRLRHRADSGCENSQNCATLAPFQKISAIVWIDEIRYQSNDQIPTDSNSCASIQL